MIQKWYTVLALTVFVIAPQVSGMEVEVRGDTGSLSTTLYAKVAYHPIPKEHIVDIASKYCSEVKGRWIKSFLENTLQAQTSALKGNTFKDLGEMWDEWRHYNRIYITTLEEEIKEVDELMQQSNYSHIITSRVRSMRYERNYPSTTRWRRTITTDYHKLMQHVKNNYSDYINLPTILDQEHSFLQERILEDEKKLNSYYGKAVSNLEKETIAFCINELERPFGEKNQN